MSEGWSVQEAAQRLLCSEATVRRRLASSTDPLTTVAGSNPVRVTHASLAAVQAEMLRRMGIEATPSISGVEVSPDSTAPTPGSGAADELARMQARIDDLQGALADLTAANAAMLDTYRRLSEGSRPNN